MVVLVCTVVLCAVLLWLAVSTVVCLGDALRRPDRHAAARAAAGTGLFRPRFLVALLALVLAPWAATTATATAPGVHAHRRSDLPGSLDGLPLPVLPVGGVVVHRVRAAESLWSIAADALPAGAGSRTVARTWPRVYRLNRQRIGRDPDLIRPGTALRLPAPWRPEDRRPENWRPERAYAVRPDPRSPEPTRGASR